jgi:tRNA 5-methylaminomethyl-2-thiouridine biosynthesis bifunctional protein
MSSPIVPATPAFDAAGTPYSPHYGDIYHSADSGPGQARHVFLGGNDLPARWAGARVFTILETGFGPGLNFLATWQAWRGDPARCERLHFVSVEKHPFTREGLAELHARYPEFAPLAAELRSAWPLLLPGLHRLPFEDGRLTLTLALGDIAALLPKLALAADALYLDGFAPERNAEMWSPATMKALARLARPGATLATYTAARAVREALAAAGFTPALRPGFGRKRHFLAARLEPARALRASPAPAWPQRRAIVIGAGLAGAAVCGPLAARGWAVELVERHPAPATEASGIEAGVFHPHVSRDDSLLSRLTRAGHFLALRDWLALERDGHRPEWARCGVLQVAKDAREQARLAAAARTLGDCPGYVAWAVRGEASRLAGCPVANGGLWFAGSGWARPASLVAAQIAAAKATGRLTVQMGVAAHALDRAGDAWRVRSAEGRTLATAPVVVLANSHDAARLAAPGAPLARVRGQLTHLPPGSLPLPAAVLAGAGHLIPLPDGTAVVGATFDHDDESTAARAEDHAGNLDRLARLLPGAGPLPDPARLAGSVGLRCVSPDRLPLIGAMPDAAAPADARNAPRLPGLYGAFACGSRGLTWAALAGELIASLLEGEPLPVESDLAGAVDPGRFLLRRARRGRG